MPRMTHLGAYAPLVGTDAADATASVGRSSVPSQGTGTSSDPPPPPSPSPVPESSGGGKISLQLITKALLQHDMEAINFADARKEFKHVLERVGAKPDATIVCMKGYGSRMDEVKHPFKEDSLKLLDGVDVVIWDGDWLKRTSFTYVIGEFLRRDPSRRAVGFRKKAGDPTKVIKSWTEPIEVDPYEMPDPGQLALCFVQMDLVDWARKDLRALEFSEAEIKDGALGWLSSQVSASSRAVAVGGGDTCEIEAKAWARLRAQIDSRQWRRDEGVPIPVWNVLPIGRQGKTTWETPVKLLRIVDSEYLGQEISRFEEVRQTISGSKATNQASLHYQAKEGNHYAVLGLLKSRAVMAKLRAKAKIVVAGPELKDEDIDKRAKQAAVAAKLQEQAKVTVVVSKLREKAKASGVEDADIEAKMEQYAYKGSRSHPHMERTITQQMVEAPDHTPIDKLTNLILSKSSEQDRETKQKELKKYVEDESAKSIDATATEGGTESEQIENLIKLILSCTDEADRTNKKDDLRAFVTAESNTVDTKVTAGDTELQIANLTQLILSHTPKVDRAKEKKELEKFISTHRAKENSLLWRKEERPLEKLETRDGWDQTALYVAAMEGKYEAAELLIDAKADVNAETSDERKTPLLAAAEKGHGRVAELLIKNGADLSFLKHFKGRFENTVMHIAAQEGHVDVVQLLIKACNGLIHDTNEDGFTPLHVAATHQKADVAAKLIEAKADVYARSTNSLRTPLHIAAERGFADVACKLIQAEASGWNHLDKDSKNPVTAPKTIIPKDTKKDKHGDVWFKDESGESAPDLVMGSSVLRPAIAEKRAGVAAVLTCAGKYDNVILSTQDGDRYEGPADGPRDDPNWVHKQCQILRQHLRRTAEEDLADTVNACIDVLHCGFWTRRLDSVVRTFELAITLSDEAYKQHQRILTSQTAVANKLRQCADRAQHVCVNLLKQLPDADVDEMLNSNDGKRAMWKASALRCAHVVAWPKLCRFMVNWAWGGEESVLNIKYPNAPHHHFACSSLARSVQKRIGWLFATSFIVVPINIVMLPIVALVPPLQNVMAKKFVASSKLVNSGLIPCLCKPSALKATHSRAEEQADEDEPKLSLYLLDDPYVGIFLATVSDSWLTYLIITRVGVGTHKTRMWQEYMTLVVSLWLVAALINEVKEMIHAFKMDQFWAHYHDPLNKLRILGIITTFPALIFIGDNNKERHEKLQIYDSISEACLAFSIVCWVITVAMRVLLTRAKLGPLVLVSFKMLDDVKRWSILVGFVIMSFATALNHTFRADSTFVAELNPTCQEIVQPYTEGLVSSATSLVHVILDTGTTNMECFENSDFWLSGSMLMYGFQLVVVILYLNMLIGMMSETLQGVSDESVTRQFLFANMVQRYSDAIPAPVSLLSLPFETVSFLCSQCNYDVLSASEKCLGLTDESQKATQKFGNEADKRDLELKRKDLLDLHALKEKVDKGVTEDETR